MSPGEREVADLKLPARPFSEIEHFDFVLTVMPDRLLEIGAGQLDAVRLLFFLSPWQDKPSGKPSEQ